MIDGNEADNDALLAECLHQKTMLCRFIMHESLDRLERLAADYHRIALGSSGEFAAIGTNEWWERMNQMIKLFVIKMVPISEDAWFAHAKPCHLLKTTIRSLQTQQILLEISGLTRHGRELHATNQEMRAAVMRSGLNRLNSANQYIAQPVSKQLCIFGGAA